MIEGLSTIGDLKRLVITNRKRSNQSLNKSKKRQVRWMDHHYTCIRNGSRMMQNVDEINELSTPTEDLFFIYKNTHTCAERDADVPLYEAVYKCQDGTLIRVQKKHLAIAYSLSNKTNMEHAYKVDDAGLPYWVDRFLFSKIKK